MDFVIGLIAFIIMLSVIVILHELGHFLVAKHFGVYCKEFSIGMGPCLYQKQGKETAFSIRAIPFGGYVMMAGEEDGSQSEEDSWLKDIPENRRLNGIEKWKQVCIMIAGIVMNILLAWIIYMGVALAQGYVVEEAKPVVYVVEENSVAQKAGLEKDDRIIRTNSTIIQICIFFHFLIQTYTSLIQITLSADSLTQKIISFIFCTTPIETSKCQNTIHATFKNTSIQ